MIQSRRSLESKWTVLKYESGRSEKKPFVTTIIGFMADQFRQWSNLVKYFELPGLIIVSRNLAVYNKPIRLKGPSTLDSNPTELPFYDCGAILTSSQAYLRNLLRNHHQKVLTLNHHLVDSIE